MHTEIRLRKLCRAFPKGQHSQDSLGVGWESEGSQVQVLGADQKLVFFFYWWWEARGGQSGVVGGESFGSACSKLHNKTSF